MGNKPKKTDMKKVLLIVVASMALIGCGKSEADIKAEKELAEKRVSDSLSVVKRVKDSVQHIADVDFVNNIAAQLDSIK